mmetsp:Transcript_19807/g.41252  ORF Transcript_19807/g.41252 Transcript_19807/m.41252 type:complete len:223 (+) Transcript_19807:1797-2465(+)
MTQMAMASLMMEMTQKVMGNSLTKMTQKVRESPMNSKIRMGMGSSSTIQRVMVNLLMTQREKDLLNRCLKIQRAMVIRQQTRNQRETASSSKTQTGTASQMRKSQTVKGSSSRYSKSRTEKGSSLTNQRETAMIQTNQMETAMILLLIQRVMASSLTTKIQRVMVMTQKEKKLSNRLILEMIQRVMASLTEMIQTEMANQLLIQRVTESFPWTIQREKESSN